MSPAPTPALTLAEVLDKALADLIARYREATADGKVTISEVVTIGSAAVDGFVLAAQTVAGATGAEKHAAVLAAVDQFYASVIAPLDIPRIPDFIERTIVDPALGSVLHFVADGLIKAAVNRFSTMGIDGFGPTPAPVPAPAPDTGAAGP